MCTKDSVFAAHSYEFSNLLNVPSLHGEIPVQTARPSMAMMAMAAIQHTRAAIQHTHAVLTALAWYLQGRNHLQGSSLKRLLRLIERTKL